ncbi:MAG: hypothetical protein P8K10_06095 [Crocinitomicaceae bacterium]|nr:hypothetical protein [Crocinitomicaceae bacterium]
MARHGKKQLIEEGKKTLELGRFPNEILENIKDARLRKEVFDGIFYGSKVKFEDLPDKEQKIRKSRLKIIQEFTNYMTSFSIVRSSSVVLICIGLLTLISNAFGIKENLNFGLINVLLGISIYSISIEKRWINKSLYLLSILYLLFYVIELIGLGLPSNYIFGYDDDILVSRRGAATKIINLMSPYIYVVARITVGTMLFLAYKKHLKFKKMKAEFEASYKFY